ncbi:MAG: Hint domain-containing protein [Pseudomonadota bacterium]
MTDFAPTTTTGLLTLWDFNTDSTTTVNDQASAGGFENGDLRPGAVASDGKLVTDGREGAFVAGPDDDWQLDSGRIEMVFNQTAHVGSSNDTILSRDSSNFDDGGHLNIAVTRDGEVEVRHQTDDESFFFRTDEDFFDEGDDVRVTYAWDSNGEGGFFKVENLSKPDQPVFEQVITTPLTLDQGPDLAQPFAVGASLRQADNNPDATPDRDLSQYFNGEIAYVAIFDSAVPPTDPAGPDFIVEGTSGADVIDAGFDGDPDGDLIDAGDNATGGDEDVVDAGAGDDTVEAGAAADTVFAGSGDDSVLGGGADDIIFGDTALGGATSPATERESFNWDEVDPSDLNTDDGSSAQVTGNARVVFTTDSDAAVNNSFKSNLQNVDDIDTGDEAINPNSSFGSLIVDEDDSGTYSFDFQTADGAETQPVENVSFRVNDIDVDSVVKVTAFVDGAPVEVVLTAGSGIDLEDTDSVPGSDTAESDGGSGPDTSAEFSLLVEIPGPVDHIVIEHTLSDDDNSAINITDVFFDAPTPVVDEGPGDDTLIGGAGDDLIFGETGDDSIEGNAGDDTLFGDDPAEGTVLGPNLIVNGSFEDTTGLDVTGFGFQSEDGVIPGWTDATGEEIDLHNDGRGGLDATDGENWLDLEASPGNNAVGQNVQGVVDGETYRLTFDAADAGFLSETPSDPDDENLVTVLFGGEVVAEIDPAQGAFESFEFEVIGGSGDGSNRLEFVGSGQLDNFGASIDNVELVLVAGPEGAGGNDTIDGGDGDDVIDGQGGDDSLIGGSGSDTITDLDGDNVIEAGPLGTPDLGFPFIGDVDSDPSDDLDSVVTGAGDDTISTGDDADTIDAGDGDNVIDGGFDADQITAGGGDDEITGGEGSDTITSGGGDDTILGGVGEDLVNLIDDNVNPINNDPIPGNDIDSLSNGDDLIDAGAGDDVVFGEDDDDTIDGGTGDDTLDGGIDDDVILGGAGDDSIIGGQGADDLSGGTGDDTFKVGNFVDPVFGDSYAEGVGDTIVGGEDPDGNDKDVLDLSTAGPLKIIFDEDLDPADQVDPGGTPGEAGKVQFFEDAEKTILIGEMKFSEIENVIPCFTPGTMIATPTGEVPVENLQVGDRVITRDNGLQEIRWVRHRTLNRDELLKAPNLRPILIKEGSLGHGLPERDMLVSPQHRVLVSDEKTQLYFEESEVLVAAKHLLNSGSIVRMDTLRTTYIHFMFDRHEVVLSDGAWTESFQPGDQSLGGMGKDQRDEIFDLFPALVTKDGLNDFQAARRALKSHEAKLLQF